MERMGDILARTAAARARQARQKTAAPAPDPARPDAPRAAMPDTLPAKMPARPPTAARNAPHGRAIPARPGAVRPLPARIPAAPSAPTTPPRQPTHADLVETPPGAAHPTFVAPADVAELTGTTGREDAGGSDRILELPPRRLAARAQEGGMPWNTPPRLPDATTTSARDEQRPRPARPTLVRGAGRLREAAAGYSLQDQDSDVCPICGGAGFLRVDLPVGDPMFGKPVPCECKERQLEQRRRDELQQLSGFTPFHDKTFATFDPAVQGTREAFDVARAYAADPRGWLVLSGPYGVGKTHLAAAIANESLAQGNTTFFSIVPDLLDHLRSAFAPSSELPYDTLFDKIREAFLVVLDDLGSENSTAWATEKLFQLINYRYNLGYPTVITTNDRLLAHIDERVRSRLADISLVRHVTIKAQDFRQRHVTGRRDGARGTGAGASKTPAGPQRGDRGGER